MSFMYIRDGDGWIMVFRKIVGTVKGWLYMERKPPLAKTKEIDNETGN